MRDFKYRCLRWISSTSCWPYHWYGECVFGTKKDTLTVTEPFRLPVISRCKSSTLYAKSAIPAKSSSVSVGSPIIKYNLTVFQPDLKAFVHAANKSSSLTPLLITSRIRCVPASGAKVRPLLRTCCTFFAISMEKLSIRKDGKLTLTCLSLNSSMSISTNSGNLE